MAFLAGSSPLHIGLKCKGVGAKYKGQSLKTPCPFLMELACSQSCCPRNSSAEKGTRDSETEKVKGLQ